MEDIRAFYIHRCEKICWPGTGRLDENHLLTNRETRWNITKLYPILLILVSSVTQPSSSSSSSLFFRSRPPSLTQFCVADAIR